MQADIPVPLRSTYLNRRTSATWDASCPDFGRGIAEVEEGRGHGGLGTWLLRGAQQPNEHLLRGHWLRCGDGEIGGQCASGADIAPILSLLDSEPRKRA